MRRYYDGPDVTITDDLFIVWHPKPHAFRIDRLRDIHVALDGLPAPRRYLAHWTGGATVLMAAILRIAPTLGGMLIALALLVILGVANGACWRIGRRGYQLRAVYHGVTVVLFASADERVFGQVRRGLVRALEGNGQVCR